MYAQSLKSTTDIRHIFRLPSLFFQVVSKKKYNNELMTPSTTTSLHQRELSSSSSLSQSGDEQVLPPDEIRIHAMMNSIADPLHHRHDVTGLESNEIHRLSPPAAVHKQVQLQRHNHASDDHLSWNS